MKRRCHLLDDYLDQYFAGKIYCDKHTYFFIIYEKINSRSLGFETVDFITPFLDNIYLFPKDKKGK